jgi:hypothetical protein
MARDEQPREDLLAEATALVPRARLRVADWPDPVVVGFRRDGGASFYFGDEPAFHFNSRGELRRAYAAGRLYKAERGQLVALDRRRTAGAVELVRHELSPGQRDAFLKDLQSRLERLRAALAAGSYALEGQVPEDADVAGRALQWLASCGASTSIARTPRAG